MRQVKSPLLATCHVRRATCGLSRATCHVHHALRRKFVMRKTAIAAVIVVATAVIGYGRQAPSPDVVLVNGRIYTLVAARPWAEAVAIAGSRITAVGTDAEIRPLATPATRVIDLKGAFALPGFN